MYLINISKLKSSLIILIFVLALIPASYVLAQTSPQTSTTLYYEYNYLTTAGDVDLLRFDAIITDIGTFLTGSAVILSPVTALDGSNADFNIKLLPAPSIRFDSSDVNSRFSSTLTAQVTHANGNVYVITVNNYIDSFPTGVSQTLTVLPTFTAAITAYDTITLTFSENVDTTTLDGSGYTISRGEVTANSDPGGFSNVMTLTTSRITSTTPAIIVAYARISGTTVTTLCAEVSTVFNTVPTIPVFDPSNPTDAITDGDEFTELFGANDITTVKIGNNTYALVASFDDDGVQIIDITNPAEPTATAAIIDDKSTALDGASSITTVNIGINTYALVASSVDNGVQIIDITNPATPTATAAITDGDEFTELKGASSITTVNIGTNTYALVASLDDDGVQIIDITNPATPTATAAITDGTVFTTLDRASSITTVNIGTNTYALVASSIDNGVQIIDITNPATPTATAAITDGDEFTELKGASSITTVNIGTNTYALVASLDDNGVQIIDITNPATPTATAAIIDGDVFTTLNRASSITTVNIGINTYALVTSLVENGVQIIDITNPASPTAITAIIDGDTFTELEGTKGITTVNIGTNTYALVASFFDDGVQIIQLTHGNLIPMIDDARPPEFLSSTLDEGTGVLEVSFSEAIDQSQPSSISTSGFRISDLSDTDSISLSGASFATISASTISITLNESQRQSVISLDVPVLDIESSTVRDIVQNNIASSKGNTISLTPDTIAPTLSITSLSPADGTIAKVGDTITLTLTADGAETGISIINMPTINGIDSTFAETGNGVYTISYTIVEGNNDVSDADPLPVSITLQDTARNPAIAITSVNANIAPGIDANAPTLSITSLSPADSTIAKVGDTITLTLTADGAETGISIINMPTINGIDSTFAETGNGVYTISYTIVEGNNDVSDADPLPVSITLQDTARNPAIAITSITANIAPGIDANAPALGNIVFVDSQTITIDINEDIIVPSSFLFTISPSLGVITETYDITSDIITLSTMIPAMDNTSYVITYPEITDLHNNTLHSGIRSVSTSDVTVPTFSARTMSTTTISITFSEPLTGTTTHNQWMVGDTNVTSVSPTVLTGITTIELTLDSALAIDSIPSVTYTQSNSVQLTDGTNPLETMTVTATDGIISLINHLLRVSDTGIFVIFDRNVKSIANETPSITLTLSSPLATSPTLGTPNIVSIEGSAIFIDGFNSTFLNVGQFDIHIANIADISDNAIDGTQSSLTLVRNIEFEATDITIPNIAIDPLVISTPSGHDTFTLTITPQSDGRYKIPSMITIRVPGSELIIPDDTTYTVSATTADELIVRSDPTRHGITHILAMSIINSDNHIVELLNDQLHTPLALVELGSDSSDATLSKPVSKRLENTAGSDYIYHINTPHTQNTRIVHIITECPDSTVTATNAPTLISDHEYYITDGNDIVI